MKYESKDIILAFATGIGSFGGFPQPPAIINDNASFIKICPCRSNQNKYPRTIVIIIDSPDKTICPPGRLKPKAIPSLVTYVK